MQIYNAKIPIGFKLGTNKASGCRFRCCCSFVRLFGVDLSRSSQTMTLNETTTLLPYLANVTWIDDNETLHYESSVLPQHHVQYVTQNSFSVSTTVRTTTSALHNAQSTATWIDWLSSGRLQIPLYATILLLAIVGNSLVIMTLVQNRRMRTITNVFLLNLAVSDILLGVFCMPFTLVGTLLRDFVFGELMCKFIPYLQANNLVEVYINAHGTPSTRCPSSCHHQSRENIPWHQLRGNCSHESSMITNSAKKHSPGLRRAKPIDCGTELNVMNYMHSANRNTSTNQNDQLIVDSCKLNDKNQTSTTN